MAISWRLDVSTLSCGDVTALSPRRIMEIRPGLWGVVENSNMFDFYFVETFYNLQQVSEMYLHGDVADTNSIRD